jgi:hypothetical protein
MSGSGAPRDFILVIPVADRPRHLAECLRSLAAQRRRHPYAGDVRVLVVDDSLDAANSRALRQVAEAARAAGQACQVLDQDGQRDLLAALPAELRARLASLVGDGAARGHKGASICRNLAYLWLRRLPEDGRERLFWFLDSDQEFRVNGIDGDGETLDYALDYFGVLDRIFRETPTRVLTGKVVGDPPVSPAVMAGNLLDDVLAFVDELAGREPGAACAFHGAARPADDAAYHDMADLFGFARAEAFRYRCPLAGAHDHAACLAEFGARLGRFFDGEHPTRRTYYVADASDARPTPARTVYTGNYVIRPEALDWCIPFAALKLRMAGPTLGRLVQASLGEAFVAANLPMLHKRTVADSGASECRPGVARADSGVDLSEEFERQYHGDVMLFSIERLCARGFPERAVAGAEIAACVDEVGDVLARRYRDKQTQVVARLDALEARLNGLPGHWRAEALAGMRRFAADLRRNFAAGAPAWARIECLGAARRKAIVDAIAAYPEARAAWREALLAARP